MIAHIDEKSGRIQSLYDHSIGVSILSSKFCSEIGLTNVGKVCGILHDLGKATSEFQEYIQGSDTFHRGDIDHSTSGATYLEKYNYKDIAKEAIHMMELCILSHHSGLIDCIDVEGVDNFHRRLEKDLYLLDMADSDLIKIMNIADGSIGVAVKELSDLIGHILQTSRNIPDKGIFRLGLLERFILSTLVDADHSDTRKFINPYEKEIEQHPWSELIYRLETYLKTLSTEGRINQIRSKISDDCYKAAHQPIGIYSLSVPTGGGKTLAGLRFALHHAKHNGLNHILFIIPYTSIIEQNANVVKNILEKQNEQIVLEYHSNVDPCDKNDEIGTWRYYTDSWDVQITFTTMVQYLNTFFASGSGHVKRLHNLSKSVIIFDEIQTIPIKCIKMFNESVNFITKYCSSTVVLCTATQPLLDKIDEYPLENITPIIPDPVKLEEEMKRTESIFVNPHEEWCPEQVSDYVTELHTGEENILIITNTKKFAKAVHNNLKNNLPKDVFLFHLSTNMCPAHRKEVFAQIKKRLPDKKVICVSTQLIEAGVDLDFDTVIRMAAGVDSIAQAAGRCNRNGLHKELKKVHIIKSNENLSNLKDIYEGRRCMLDVFREKQSLLSSSAISTYFDYYYHSRNKDMKYPVNNNSKSLFELLSQNTTYRQLNIDRFHIYPEMALCQAFKEANGKFTVIDENNSVIVPFNDEAKKLISDICSDSADRKTIFRKLHNYSINTFELEKMIAEGIVSCISEECRLYALVDGYYHPEYGLDKETNNSLMIF